jgi:hypothetical protein
MSCMGVTTGFEEALNLAYHGARVLDASFNVTLERDFDRGLAPTELAPQEMTRVFLNLFGNGFYATAKRQHDGAGPEFRPTLKVATRDLGEVVEVRVRYNGTGIAPEIRDKLFQPFITTKPKQPPVSGGAPRWAAGVGRRIAVLTLTKKLANSPAPISLNRVIRRQALKKGREKRCVAHGVWFLR